MQQQLRRILRWPEVMAFSGMKPTQIRQQIALGEFPKPIPLNDTGRSKGWLESELIGWQERRVKKRTAQMPVKPAMAEAARPKSKKRSKKEKV